MNWARKTFKYIEPLWIDMSTKRISLKGVASIALIVDFIINVHNSASVALQILKLIYKEKAIDAAVVSAMATNLSQVVLILGIEAGLITALLGLKAYQNQKAVAAEVQDNLNSADKGEAQP